VSEELIPLNSDALISELRTLVHQSRNRAARSVNSELVWLYWHVGCRLRTELLGDERAEYGKQVVDTVAASLSADFGRGFDRRNLYRMMRFAEVFPNSEIVAALRTQLSWTHLRELIAIEDPLKRQFYTEICRLENWSTRTLKAKMDGMLFERTAIAKRPTAVIEETLSKLESDGHMSPDMVFRDPYVLDFLGMPGTSAKRNLKRLSCGNSSSFFWNSVPVSALWRVRSDCRSGRMTTTWTYLPLSYYDHPNTAV
jgi:hypothetical protein